MPLGDMGKDVNAVSVKKIDIVIGTRPEAIKMAPVILELRKRDCFDTRIVATGQHTDMLVQALDYFSLASDVNLAIMKARQSLDYITSAVLEGVGAALDERLPDAVLVHGDTTTTFAAALAAFYRKIPVGHVEAGLRSHDMAQPFPEEMNRVLTDRMATWWFAPTDLAKNNLLSEGVDEGRIYVTGNTVVDALLSTVNGNSEPKEDAMKILSGDIPFILLTAHRRESWGRPLEEICAALMEVLKRHPDCHALVPMHRNPAVRDTMQKLLGANEKIVLCDPLDYPDFVRALHTCRLILSDSGGVQEEATALCKPLLILRDVTERPEAVRYGSGILVGTDSCRIISEADRLLSDREAYAEIERRCERNPFGDGRVSARIADVLSRDLQAISRSGS